VAGSASPGVAGNAPPPLWEDVRSQLNPKVGRGRAWLIVPVVLIGLGGAGYVAWKTWGFGVGAILPSVGPVDAASTTAAPPPEGAPTGASATGAPTGASATAAAPTAGAPTAGAAAIAGAGPSPAATVASPPISCPPATVAIPGPKAVCIDQFEYPGEKQLPRTQVSFVEAAQLCGARGARLCTETEWERACRGPGGSLYPYGASFAAGKCNSKGAGGKPIASGLLPECRSAAGAFDMSGNVAEWVIVEPQQLPAERGGSATSGDPAASCAHRTETASLAGTPLVGFRCCRDAAK
jgi:hypothetical protein